MIALVLLAGCHAARQDGWLVWDVRRDGTAETRTLGGDGAVLDVAETVMVAAGERVWRSVDEPVDVPRLDCQCLETADDGVDCTVRDPGARRFFTDGTRRVEWAVPSADPETSASTELVGSVGPWVFVRRSSFVFRCGASVGDAEESIDVVALGETPAWDLDAAGRDAWLRAHAEQAAAALGAPPTRLRELTFDGWLPRWTDRGLAVSVEVGARLCPVDCEASDNPGADQPVRGLVPVAAPAAFAPYARVPDAVVAAAPGDAVAWGWSRLPAPSPEP